MNRGLAGGIAALRFLLLALPGPAAALDLTGVLIYGADQGGAVKGPIWHTSLGRSARVLGLTRWPPPGLRGIPFALDPSTGEVAIKLVAMSHSTTLFWQYHDGEFPPAMVLNLYFNGDNSSPRISAVVPFVYGLTRFFANPAPSTLALDASEVDNQGGLSFDDGGMRARLGVAFYFPSSGDVHQWRPADFVNLDRVGTDRLEPDGSPDGIMVFELVVEPAVSPPPAPPGQVAPGGPAGMVAPPVARVGPDQWVAPATPALGLTSPPPALTAPPATVANGTPAAAALTRTRVSTEPATPGSPGPTLAKSPVPAAGTPTAAASTVKPPGPTSTLPTPPPTARPAGR